MISHLLAALSGLNKDLAAFEQGRASNSPAAALDEAYVLLDKLAGLEKKLALCAIEMRLALSANDSISQWGFLPPSDDCRIASDIVARLSGVLPYHYAYETGKIRSALYDLMGDLFRALGQPQKALAVWREALKSRGNEALTAGLNALAATDSPVRAEAVSMLVDYRFAYQGTHKIEGAGEINNILTIPDGRIAMSDSKHGHVLLYDPRTDTTRTLRGNLQTPCGMFHSDGKIWVCELTGQRLTGISATTDETCGYDIPALSGTTSLGPVAGEAHGREFHLILADDLDLNESALLSFDPAAPGETARASKVAGLKPSSLTVVNGELCVINFSPGFLARIDTGRGRITGIPSDLRHHALFRTARHREGLFVIGLNCIFKLDNTGKVVFLRELNQAIGAAKSFGTACACVPDGQNVVLYVYDALAKSLHSFLV